MSLKAPFIWLVRGYQILISPLKGPTCRFTPSCSEYMIQAIDSHGVVRGVSKGIWRILRCNPLGGGGFDPVNRDDPMPAPPGQADAGAAGTSRVTTRQDPARDQATDHDRVSGPRVP
ncbi:MAG: membrane protein insertion efficiency factor YidD [Planctomycetota bacterium]